MSFRQHHISSQQRPCRALLIFVVFVVSSCSSVQPTVIATETVQAYPSASLDASPTSEATITPTPTSQATATILVRPTPDGPTPRGTTATMTILHAVHAPTGSDLAQVMAETCPPNAKESDTWRTELWLLQGGVTRVVAEQDVYCGIGLGAYGLAILGWSDDARFLYYTTAANGGADGGACPWYRPAIQYDTRTHVGLEVKADLKSTDEQFSAYVDGGNLNIIEWASGKIETQPRVFPDGGLAWVSWSPDGRWVAFLENENDVCRPDTASVLSAWEVQTGRVEQVWVTKSGDESGAAGWVNWITSELLEVEFYTGADRQYGLTSDGIVVKQTDAP